MDRKYMYKTAAVLVLCCVALMMAGCCTIGELEAVKADAQKALQNSQQALKMSQENRAAIVNANEQSEAAIGASAEAQKSADRADAAATRAENAAQKAEDMASKTEAIFMKQMKK